jgi:hypothetical protein
MGQEMKPSRRAQEASHNGQFQLKTEDIVEKLSVNGGLEVPKAYLQKFDHPARRKDITSTKGAQSW